MDFHRHLDDELDVLRDRVLLLGGQAERALERAMYALMQRDNDVAREVLDHDDEIDRLEVEVDRLCVDIIARHQPAARDLRFVISVTKMATILERIADHACNIARARISRGLCRSSQIWPHWRREILRLAGSQLVRGLRGRSRARSCDCDELQGQGGDCRARRA